MERRDFLNNLIKFPYLWDFFQVVRKITITKDINSLLAQHINPNNEHIRFKQSVSLNFCSSDINKCKVLRNENLIELTVNFLGLFGANAPMPHCFTEKVYQIIHNSSNTNLIDFLNIFHHRMLSFFYEAWAINQQTVNYERGKGYDCFKYYLNSLTGNEYDLTKEYRTIHSDTIAYYSGFLLNKTCSKEKIIYILSSFFCIKVDIREYIETQIKIPESECFCLGRNDIEKDELGRGNILGSKVNDRSCRFRIILGPMSINIYDKLLPGTIGYKQLIEWMKYCSPIEQEYEVQLILDSKDIPYLTDNIKLGYNSWLITEKPCYNGADLIINNPEKEYL